MTSTISPRDEAHEKYVTARERLTREIDACTALNGDMSDGPYEGFIAATVDLLMAGLDEYLAAGAKDRASADLDRQAMALDREDQRKVRWGMAGLTAAIVLLTLVIAASTVVSAFRKSPYPIVNISVPSLLPSPAPIVTIQPVPVNVTLAPPALPSRSLAK